MQGAILSHLKEKTCILVTHQLHVLSKADRILYLDDGEIKFLGNYLELQQTELDLSKILSSNNEESSKE